MWRSLTIEPLNRQFKLEFLPAVALLVRVDRCRDRQTTVGTCAVIPVSADEFELSKMAVDPMHRCQGYGARLMEVAIDFARKAGASKISLITDTKLPDAIKLYQRYGFQIIPYTPDPRYKRGDLRMGFSFN